MGRKEVAKPEEHGLITLYIGCRRKSMTEFRDCPMRKLGKKMAHHDTEDGWQMNE